MCLSSSTWILQDRPVREALKASVPCGCEAQEARGLHALRTDASREQRTPAAQMLELELTLRGLFHNSLVAFPPGGLIWSKWPPGSEVGGACWRRRAAQCSPYGLRHSDRKTMDRPGSAPQSASGHRFSPIGRQPGAIGC